jgi:NAD(P)-dependent dehydrogenase (short-subunit alcohol dehydrogenase family)
MHLMDSWTVLYAMAGASLLVGFCVALAGSGWCGVSAWPFALGQSFIVTRVRAPGFHVDGKHVFITGGSSGIGLATAKKYAQVGAKVSIVARDAKKLEAAKRELEAVSKRAEAPVFTQTCDVVDFEAVKKAVGAANAWHGRVVDHVICSAGSVEPGYFMEQDVAGFRHSMDVNYFGCLHVLHAALPAMIKRREADGGKNGGQVVLVGSAFSLMACIGTAQYSSSKYAVRGLAESLRNEMLLHDIRVSVFYPGNVDTPMLQHEIALTPPETKTIEGVSAPLSPEAAAQTLVNGVAKGHFSITTDPLVYLLRILSNGVTPRHNTVLEAAALPLIMVVQVGFLFFMDAVVGYSRWQRGKQRKSDKKGQ